MEWYEVNAAGYSTFGSGLSGPFRTRNVVRPLLRAAVAPISQAQYNAFVAAFAASGPFPTALAAFGGWFRAMQNTIPQLAAALNPGQLANLFNLITASVAFNAGSPWRDGTYALTALNGILSAPGQLSGVVPLWVYFYTGNALLRSRSNNWACDQAGANAQCAGLHFSVCPCVICCYDLKYGRLAESIPALDAWGDAAGLHNPATGAWSCGGGATGCGNDLDVADCDPNHPCSAGYSCVTIGVNVNLPPEWSRACIIDHVNPPGCNGVGTACSADGQCCAGLNCQGGNCQVAAPSCHSQAECSLGYVCVSGTCVPVGPGNCLPPAAVCSNTVQCCPGTVCNVVGASGPGSCTDPSTLCGDATCPPNTHCSNNICVPNVVDPCANVHCGTGYHCDNGNCIPDNPGCSSLTCLPPNSCQNGSCVAPGQGCDATTCHSPNYCANGVCTTPPTCTAANCPPPFSCVGNVCTGGGDNSLVIVLGILGLIGVGAAVVAGGNGGS